MSGFFPEEEFPVGFRQGGFHGCWREGDFSHPEFAVRQPALNQCGYSPAPLVRVVELRKGRIRHWS